MASDKLDWHLDAAASQGDPDHGFVHIAAYLAWLFARGWQEPAFFDRSLVRRVLADDATLDELIDATDEGKLVPDMAIGEGRRFGLARYRTYLDRWSQLSGDHASYRVAWGRQARAQAASILDDLHRDWVAAGQSRGTARAPGAHDHPEIEHLLPDELDGVALQVDSLTAERFGLDADAIDRLGVDPMLAGFVSGQAGRGPLVLVAIGVLPGVLRETIEREYIGVELAGVGRTVGGVPAVVDGRARAAWATDERLFLVVTRTERALPRFVRAVAALPRPPAVMEPSDGGRAEAEAEAIADLARLAEPVPGQGRERGFAALGLALSPGSAARDALRASLASDPDPRVRFMAAQGLLMREHHDHASFPAIAALIRELAASGDRDSAGLASGTAFLIGQYMTHARLGFVPVPTEEEVAAATSAIEDARASGRSGRGRNSFETVLQMIHGDVPSFEPPEAGTAEGGTSSRRGRPRPR